MDHGKDMSPPNNQIHQNGSNTTNFQEETGSPEYQSVAGSPMDEGERNSLAVVPTWSVEEKRVTATAVVVHKLVSGEEKKATTVSAAPAAAAVATEVATEVATNVATEAATEVATDEGVGVAVKGVYRLPSVTRRLRREEMVRKVALVFRVLGIIFTLVSFSVMAADNTQGWAGDSFYRYKEYRYCISVTVIGFIYSGFQAYRLTQQFITEKDVIQHPLRYHLDFFLDQMLAYLLLSASSSAATRTDDWVTNWGEDEFTKMATASTGMSFLAFFTFAFSALISGYRLCNPDF